MVHASIFEKYEANTVDWSEMISAPIWGMLYPLHEGKIALEPDFDSEILEGEFFCKGRIHIFVYIWTAYIILFDKNIKHLKKCLLREDD